MCKLKVGGGVQKPGKFADVIHEFPLFLKSILYCFFLWKDVQKINLWHAHELWNVSRCFRNLCQFFGGSTSTILLTISVAHFSAWWGSNNCVATFFNFLYCGLISSETVHWLTKCKNDKSCLSWGFSFLMTKTQKLVFSLFFLLPLAVLVQLFYSENTQISWKLPFSGGALYRSNQLICWVKTDSCLLKSTFVIFVYF